MQAKEFVEKLYKACEARGIEQFEVFIVVVKALL